MGCPSLQCEVSTPTDGEHPSQQTWWRCRCNHISAGFITLLLYGCFALQGRQSSAQQRAWSFRLNILMEPEKNCVLVAMKYSSQVEKVRYRPYTMPAPVQAQALS